MRLIYTLKDKLKFLLLDGAVLALMPVLALLIRFEGGLPDRGLAMLLGLAAWLRSQDGVSYVSLALREKETVRQSMQSLNMIVLLVVVCAAAMASIVLCTLTNINIMERVREVATVKVLGFNPGEPASYILRENLLLSILGGAVGLLLGQLLHRFIMELIQVDYMCYEVRISALSYLLAFGITVLFALAANFAMSFKLEKINMTESLKSVE